jgi:hypothetical protein
VCGSLYLAGEVLAARRKSQAQIPGANPRPKPQAQTSGPNLRPSSPVHATDQGHSTAPGRATATAPGCAMMGRSRTLRRISASSNPGTSYPPRLDPDRSPQLTPCWPRPTRRFWTWASHPPSG